MKFRLTSPFGELSEVHPNPHSGIDLAMSEGTPLRSVVNGVVEKVVDYGNQNLGKGVIIDFDDGKRAIYGHMHDTAVKSGDKINYGDLIGHSGSTGHSTGPHLHFGIKDHFQSVDPTPFREHLDEICGHWDHVDVGDTMIALGTEDPTTHIDLIGYIFDLLDWLPI